jgi:hypothetical protein
MVELLLYFLERSFFSMLLNTLKGIFRPAVKNSEHVKEHVNGGGAMKEIMMLHGAEPREILRRQTDEKATAIMSYLSRGKWHVANIVLTELGANRFNIDISQGSKRHPINVQIDQPVGISVKSSGGKLVFETKVVGLERSCKSGFGGIIALEIPSRMEMIQRRSYFRVKVPDSLKVNMMIWHHHAAETDQTLSHRYWPATLVDISAGGLQVAVENKEMPDFVEGQFLGFRFTPWPYETPLILNAKVRSILPTADDQSVCIGLQMVGLEASLEGREKLNRICEVVEKYYKINNSAQSVVEERHERPAGTVSKK